MTAGEEPENGRVPVFCVAGTSSGVGKTSICVGIMRALRNKGLTVQAFKTGPDFIDRMHHQQATGRPSINLDTWMLTREQVLASFHLHTADADVAVVEGVMGLFDGRDGTTEQGSTAQLAKWLGAPVVLVLDASAIARSAAAVAKGYIEFDSELQLAGILFNKVGGPAHTQWLKDALAASGIKATVLGGVPKDDAVVVPERHLGLHMPHDASVPANLVDALSNLVSTHLDLDALLELAAGAAVPPPPPETPPPLGAGLAEPAERARPVRIAVAKDAAFCFYYHDNLALLQRAGAEIVFFSPLVEPLPADIGGVYLGGGYPERYAADLADNRLLRASLLGFARAGGVVYAECGGLLYLSKSIQPHEEEPASAMVGVFPFKTIMTGKMTMGYVEVETWDGCPLFPPGRKVRGQVYHFSEIVQESVVGGMGTALGGKPAADQAWSTCYTVQPQIPGAAEVAEGFCCQNVLASYVHLHFGNCPEFASALVDKCRAVDAAAVSAAASEATQTAAYLDSTVTSQHSSPQQLSQNGRVMHCRSSPEFAREDLALYKQRTAAAAAAAAAAEGQRRYSEDPLQAARHNPLLPASDSGALRYLPRHSLQVDHAGVPPRTLSPATTLSKIASMGSLNSYSPHIGVLPQGDALTPPLSESPQQLSPRELEMQVAQQPSHAQRQYFADASGGGCGSCGQHQHAAGLTQGAQNSSSTALMQLQQYGSNGALMGMEQTPPPPYARQQSAPPGGLGQARNSCSWPRGLHYQGLPPAGYGPMGSRHSSSAFASAAAQQQPYHHHPSSAGFYAATGGSLHSRTGSGDRSASAGPAAMLVGGRSPTPLDLHGLEPRHLAMSATPYNWQHSHPPSDKIVSLSPGATEMLWALGLGARVAAVSDTCDFPPAAVARAKARRSFAALSPYLLDRGGSDAASSGGGSRRESPTHAQMSANGGAAGGDGSGGQAEDVVDEEVLARERPGLVVYEEDASSACGCGTGTSMMCSSDGGGMGHAVLEALVAVGLQQSCRVVCVRRRTLSDVLESMLVVGEAASVREEALRTVDRLRARLRRIAGEAAAAAAAAPSRPRVLVLQSLRPLRTVGWWAADQLTLAGGSCWLEEHSGDAAVDLTWEQVQAFAPEVLVVAGMGGGSALRPLTDLCTIASLPGWWLLPAVRSSSVFVCDSALFCRPGPRLVEGVECLARMLWEDEGVPDCSCPEQAVLKLSLRAGQRCRPRLLPNQFVPFA